MTRLSIFLCVVRFAMYVTFGLVLLSAPHICLALPIAFVGFSAIVLFVCCKDTKAGIAFVKGDPFLY